MLVDVERWSNDSFLRMIVGVVAGNSRGPERIGRGLYTNCGYNFPNFLPKNEWEDIWSHFYKPEGLQGAELRAVLEEMNRIPEYGVVDSIENFIELFGKVLEEESGQYCVGFTEVRKDREPSEGGWRWHKWGQYYGKKHPQCEYIHDEPEIDSVFTFNVVVEKEVNSGVQIQRSG